MTTLTMFQRAAFVVDLTLVVLLLLVTPPPTTPVGAECSSLCWTLEAKRRNDIENIKATILRKLNMKHAPNITVPEQLPRVPYIQQVLESYEMMSDAPQLEPESGDRRLTGSRSLADDFDGEHATTSRVFHFGIPTRDEMGVFSFRLQQQVKNSQIAAANLGIYVLSRRERVQTTILVYHRTWFNGARVHRTLILKKRVSIPGRSSVDDSRGSWQVFNITGTVEEFLRSSRNDVIEFQVHVSDHNGQQLVVSRASNNDEQLLKPYLEIQLKEQSSAAAAARLRRSSQATCDVTSPERHCCRYPLVVDFEEYGWNWIIAPKRYSAFYCAGECNFRYLMTHSHGFLVQQERLRDATATPVGGPCCAPRKMSQISMLYYNNDGNVLHSFLSDMVVEQCGCS